MNHGKIVRIGPKHIFLATPQAVKDIYGYGTPATKDNFYGALASTHLNVSDAQEKSVHTVKRKRFATAFAQKSITDLVFFFCRGTSPGTWRSARQENDNPSEGW